MKVDTFTKAELKLLEKSVVKELLAQSRAGEDIKAVSLLLAKIVEQQDRTVPVIPKNEVLTTFPEQKPVLDVDVTYASTTTPENTFADWFERGNQGNIR